MFTCSLISIHVPARGTTHYAPFRRSGFFISIHLPARVRLRWRQACQTTSKFQSTYPHGYDGVPAACIVISGQFQSTYPHGVRPVVSVTTGLDGRFQSTYPHGVRPETGVDDTTNGDFNPRTRTGYDKIVRKPGTGVYISIHVPARGTTHKNANQTNGHDINFNPRTRTGYDTTPTATPSRTSDFNPRTRTGYDNRQGCEAGDPGYFNPRTRTGYDHSGSTPTVTFLFQSTYPHGVRQLVQAQTRCSS